MYAALGKWVGTGLLTGGLWASTVGPAMAADRTEAKREAIPVPTPMSIAAPPAGLDAVTPLPGGSIPWAAVAVPPVLEGAGGGTLVQGGGAKQLRYYALDALGPVRVVFDAAGQVVSRADYEPFGAAVPASTTGTLPRQQYTGHERDGEVGVDYFGARMYAPTLGRMPSVDPLYVGAIEDPQRWNRYAYARSNPVSMSDPDGRHVAVSCWLSSWVFDDGWHFAGFRHGTCASPLPIGPGDTGNQEPGGGGRGSGQMPAGPAGHTPDPDTPNPDSPGPGLGPTPPVPDPDPKPDPKRRNCYQTWRFRSLFDSAPSAVQIAVDVVDAASTFSFASDVYATGLKNAGPAGLDRARQSPIGGVTCLTSSDRSLLKADAQ